MSKDEESNRHVSGDARGWGTLETNSWCEGDEIYMQAKFTPGMGFLLAAQELAERARRGEIVLLKFAEE